jgi:hypothetical protein
MKPTIATQSYKAASGKLIRLPHHIPAPIPHMRIINPDGTPVTPVSIKQVSLPLNKQTLNLS